MYSRLVPENFGTEQNIESSVCADFDCVTISGKLRSYIREFRSEFLFSDELPRASIIVRSSSDIRGTDFLGYRTKTDAQLENKAPTGANSKCSA